MSYLSHLECGYCGKTYEADRLWNLCPECQKPLLARYDLAAAGKELTLASFSGREASMWRYRELLPVRSSEHILCLGEGWTPLHRARRLGAHFGFPALFIKDESLNPTTSFKARGLSAALSRAMELGVRSFSIPSAGNAGCALAAYAALGGLEAHVFMPADVPRPFVNECLGLGARVILIKGLIGDCGRAAAEEMKENFRFDCSTLKEPYRLEGKKTMGYELAEQMQGRLPDVIVYPTGGGTGLIGMWKAFAEMEEMGWIGSRRPRMVCVQAEGCAPMVKAFHEGSEFASPWPDARTVADGMRVPAAVADFLILRVLRESRGTAVAVSDRQIMQAAGLIGRLEGIFPAPEGAATLAAFADLLERGWIDREESVALFNTGSGHKYFALWEPGPGSVGEATAEKSRKN